MAESTQESVQEKQSEELLLKAAKKELRGHILQLRAQLPESERRRAAVLLSERILGHQWYYLSDTLLGFASYGSEIDTDEILRETLRQGRALYLPRVEGDAMQFYRVRSLNELQLGYKGIREPSGDTERYVYDAGNVPKTLLLMPGVAFDRMRNRMGYGGGFYDRFLADKPGLQMRAVGVGYACQLVEEVPCGAEDIRPYQVICV